MTSRSYFGKMHSILGSVVPLAMFLDVSPLAPCLIFVNFYTTALFKNVKVHQKVCHFLSKKKPKLANKDQNFAFSMLKKVHQLEKSTLPPVVAAVINMSL